MVVLLGAMRPIVVAFSTGDGTGHGFSTSPPDFPQPFDDGGVGQAIGILAGLTIQLTVGRR
jgi:hypothetical protein